MSEQAQKIKCPHCGWVRKVDVQGLVEAGAADTVRGMGETLREIAQRIQGLLSDPELEEARAWLDLPACPHCGNTYRYNVRTGEVNK